MPLRKLALALNAHLPEDIRVVGAHRCREAALCRARERERSAIERHQIGDDRQPQPGARLGLVEAAAPAVRSRASVFHAVPAPLNTKTLAGLASGRYWPTV